jgi:hypothetical protein
MADNMTMLAWRAADSDAEQEVAKVEEGAGFGQTEQEAEQRERLHCHSNRVAIY